MENFIKNRRKELGLSQTELGAQVGHKAAYISKIEKGKSPLKLDLLEKIAKVLDCAPADLIDNLNSPNDATIPSYNNHIPIITCLQAGVWKTSFEYPADDITYIAAGDDLDTDIHFAARVKGDSMNLKVPENSIVIFRCIHNLDRDVRLETGKIVAVEQVKNGEHEATLKELIIDEDTGRAHLMPRSSNPAHMPIIIPWPYAGEPDPKSGVEEIKIKGIGIRIVTDI